MKVTPQYPAKKPRKKMITVSQKSGKTLIEINSSSADVIATCKRKSQYLLNQGYVFEERSPALVYGSAIHKGLEEYYRTPIAQRDDTTLEHALIALEVEAKPLEYIEKFDKHSIDNAKETLRRYIRSQDGQGDPWEIHRDKHGLLIERSFSVDINETDKSIVRFFGTIDAVMKNQETGELAVFDYKTASRVSSEQFVNNAKPNNQFSGYIFGARAALDLPVTGLYMVGIEKKNLFARTKRGIQPPSFPRIFTERSDAELAEWRQNMLMAALDYLKCVQLDRWPQNTSVCQNYGGCQYWEVCSTCPNLRQNVLDSRYKKE